MQDNDSHDNVIITAACGGRTRHSGGGIAQLAALGAQGLVQLEEDGRVQLADHAGEVARAAAVVLGGGVPAAPPRLDWPILDPTLGAWAAAALAPAGRWLVLGGDAGFVRSFGEGLDLSHLAEGAPEFGAALAGEDWPVGLDGVLILRGLGRSAKTARRREAPGSFVARSSKGKERHHEESSRRRCVAQRRRRRWGCSMPFPGLPAPTQPALARHEDDRGRNRTDRNPTTPAANAADSQHVPRSELKLRLTQVPAFRVTLSLSALSTVEHEVLCRPHDVIVLLLSSSSVSSLGGARSHFHKPHRIEI